MSYKARINFFLRVFLFGFRLNSNYRTYVIFDREYDGDILFSISQTFLSNIETISRTSYIRSRNLHRIMSNEGSFFRRFCLRFVTYEHE